MKPVINAITDLFDYQSVGQQIKAALGIENFDYSYIQRAINISYPTYIISINSRYPSQHISWSKLDKTLSAVPFMFMGKEPLETKNVRLTPPVELDDFDTRISPNSIVVRRDLGGESQRKKSMYEGLDFYTFKSNLKEIQVSGDFPITPEDGEEEEEEELEERVLPYRSILQEAISLKDIDKWKRDFQMFTKNIRNIKNGKELSTVRDAWITWTKNFEHFVFKKFIPDEDWDFSNLRGETWPLVAGIGYETFGDPGYWDSNKNKQVYIDKYKGFEKEWDQYYEKWEKSRNKVYSKIQRIGKKAFDALYSYFNFRQKQGVIPDNYSQQSETLDGVKLNIVGRELYDDKIAKSDQAWVKKTKKNILQAIKLIKKKGLGKILSNLTINIDMKGRELKHQGMGDIASRAGHYRDGSDEISIFLLGQDIKTIVHEIGHRFDWKILTEKGQKAWEDFLESVSEKGFSEKEEESIESYAIEIGNNKDILMYDLSSIFRKIIKKYGKELDPLLQSKMETLVDEHGDTLWSNLPVKWEGSAYDLPPEHPAKQKAANYDIVSYLQTIFQKVENVSFSTQKVSSYGETNSREAFADAFAFYVLDKPLPGPVKSMFMTVAGLK